MFYILLFLNALLFSVCLLGISMESSALAEGNFVNNPILFTFVFLFNVICFSVFLQYDLESKILWSLVLILSILTLNIVTILGEFPLKNNDKVLHLMILGATAFYLIYMAFVLVRDSFLEKFKERVL
ncbi:MAG: hypothetical protein WC849_00215 [Candidatus Paceibacterota bacterium]